MTLAIAMTMGGRADNAINLLTDCSHDYSFNLSNASRTQKSIFPGVNCLTSGRTIHKLNLDPINALVVLIDGKLPYLPEDAPYLREYVEQGGGLYLGIKTGGMYADDILGFLAGLGLKDAGPRLAQDPANFGISAHAPSELAFKLNGSHARFTSRVGPWADSGGSVSFEVYGDGKRLYQGKLLRNGAREAIDTDIRGVSELRLVATDGGNGKSADGSIWFDPRLVSTSGTSERLLLKDAESVKVGWARATQDRHFNGKPLGVARARDAAKTDNAIVATEHPAALPEATWKPPSRLPNIQPSNKPGWETVYALSDGSPVVMARQYGRGVIIADTTGLYHAALGEKEPGRAAMRKLIEYMSRGKQVAAIKGGGGWQFSDGYRWDLVSTTKDGLRIHHNAYTKMYVPNDVRAYRQTVEYLTELTGLDEKHKAAQIKELKDRKAARMVGAPVDVDITGVKEITLVTTDGGNNIHYDHAIWADAFFIDSVGEKTPLRIEDAYRVKTGYGNATQDRLPDGSPLSIGGREFATGVFLHANGAMTLTIDGNYKRFTAWVGSSDRSSGSVGFKVMGDGKELWNDGKVHLGGRVKDDPENVNYVPDGILFQMKYLACVGSGFLLPQGAAVDVPPALKDDWQVHLGMLAHEMGHAWSYPFCEKIGEEASAFIFNNLVLHRHNGQKHGDSVTKRLMGYLKNRDLDAIDLAREASNFKYYMFIDLMIRECGEDVWKNYNLLKYALLNKEGAAWDAHSTAWLWSIAIGRNAFPYFQNAFGSSMDRTRVKLPAKAMAAGFDPEAVGKLYDIPLIRPSQQRDIFSTLKNFKDVRAFYAREYEEKGRPDVEG